MESELNIWQKRLQLLQQIRERENTSSPDEIIPENTQKINLPVRDDIQHNRFQAEDENIKSRLEEISGSFLKSLNDIQKIKLAVQSGNFSHLHQNDIEKIKLAVQSGNFSHLHQNDIEKIKLAIQSGNFSHPHQLAQSIIRVIKAIEIEPKEINTTSDGSLWEITLPTTGLRLSSQIALFCLTCSENSLIFQKLDEQIQKSNYPFLILVAKDNCFEQDLRQLQTIWLDYPTLQTLIETPEEEVVKWLTSTLFR